MNNIIDMRDWNIAWWQAACLAVRAAVKNETERDHALSLLALARDKANEVYHASANQHTNHSENCIGN